MSRPRGIRLRELWKLVRSRITWPELVRWLVWAYASARLRGADSGPEWTMWHDVKAALEHQRDDDGDHGRACALVVRDLRDGKCEGPWRRS